MHPPAHDVPIMHRLMLYVAAQSDETPGTHSSIDVHPPHQNRSTAAFACVPDAAIAAAATGGAPAALMMRRRRASRKTAPGTMKRLSIDQRGVGAGYGVYLPSWATCLQASTAEVPHHHHHHHHIAAARARLLRLACLSRVALLIYAVLADALIPDHNATVNCELRADLSIVAQEQGTGG